MITVMSCGRVLFGVLIAIISFYISQIYDLNYFRLIGTHPKHDFDNVARIPYTDLVRDDVTVDPLILTSMELYGFFYVYEIPGYNSSEELDYLKQFFDLSETVKMKLAVNKHNTNNVNVYRGYGPLVKNVGSQYKELFNIGPHETTPVYNSTDNVLDKLRTLSKERNVWPVTQNNHFDEEFKRVFTSGFNLRRNIATGVIRSIARSLEHPQLIERFTEHEFSTLGLRKYPVRTSVNKNMYSRFDKTTLSELEHEDSTVTILATFSNPGLQALYENSYRDVPPSRNGFIVNIGTLIEDITDNIIMAVRHRVKQIDHVRYSIPYFFNPSFDADISTSISGRKTKAGEKYKIFGEWMKDYLPIVEPALLKDKFTDV
uniref:Putative isopenicillin-n-synthase n=1 Tax=Bathyctena chuni TaxID=1403704 RepID=A0A0A0RX43_BATCU|nr:putative isopenicillin-n-synthase [Bathyctena chuni]